MNRRRQNRNAPKNPPNQSKGGGLDVVMRDQDRRVVRCGIELGETGSCHLTFKSIGQRSRLNVF
jgi:hypothetical protein